MCTHANDSHDPSLRVLRSRFPHLLGLALTLALSVVACGGGGSGPPPPNPLFVSNATGSDSNRGTADKPLHSLGRATQIAGNDYTIVVAPGTYAEAVTTDRSNASAAQRLVVLADTSGQVFQSFGGSPRSGDVTIQSPGVGIKLNSSSGTVIDGFVISGASGGGIVVNKSNQARIQNCIISGGKSPNGDAIRVQASDDVIVFNNLLYNNAERGIALVSISQNAQVINNTVLGNTMRGITVGNSDKASSGAYIHNNILQDNGPGGVGSNIKVFSSNNIGLDSLLNYDGDYNLVFPAGTYEPASLQATHDVNEDAQFANSTPSTPSDFLLSQGSPAIDAGDDFPPSNPRLPSASEAVLRVLHNCLSQWTATVGGASDQGAIDLGYHVPDSDPTCGVTLPAS